MLQDTNTLHAYYWQLIDKMAEEIKQSEDKVNALSKEMLDGRDRYQPIPDGEFQAFMNQLRLHVKGLARDIVKSLKVQGNEVRVILEENLLTNRIHEDVWADKGNRKYLIQSAIWNILKNLFFQSPFQVYGNEGQELGRTWAELFSNGWSLL